jgi:hypothetical protein
VRLRKLAAGKKVYLNCRLEALGQLLEQFRPNAPKLVYHRPRTPRKHGARRRPIASATALTA